MDNKQTGSFYTPPSLINYMVKYARERIAPNSILEPSAGDGRFAEPLQMFNCPVTLLEVEESKVKKLNESYSEICRITHADFLQYAFEQTESYDLIIGNPPYISKKTLPDNQRENSIRLLDDFGLSKELFQNIWVSFILASIKKLSPTGAVLFVLPFEFLQVQYAEKLREFLETRFNTIEITTFEDTVFTGIEQDVCLVYLGNESLGKPYIKYSTLISDTNTKATFESVIMRNKPLKKWSNCILNDGETEMLLRIASSFPQIKSFGSISPGIVTGANSFFVLSKEKIEALSISKELQLPILTKGSNIPSLLSLKESDFIQIENKKKRTRMLNLSSANEEGFSVELRNYLREGEKNEIHKRYKCKARKRWYDVPIIKKGDACFFKRFHLLPKLIVNSADIYTTDVAYNIRFKEGIDPSSFVFCFYNSLTLALCEYNGRFYGGGVGELVPSEFKSINLPYQEISSETFLLVDNMFRDHKSFSEIIDYIDSIVLHALSANEIELLQQMRNRYLIRRMKHYSRED